MLTAKDKFDRRKRRVRAHIARVVTDKPRLSVFRSNCNIYVQIIDDVARKTLASASTVEKDVRTSLKSGSNIGAAEIVGKLIAERAAKVDIKDVVFDRGGYLYHGRVKALADAARSAGLSF